MKLKTLLKTLKNVNVVVMYTRGALLQELFISDVYDGDCEYEDYIVDKITTLVDCDTLFVYLKRSK